jgi:hypothetical protein
MALLPYVCGTADSAERPSRMGVMGVERHVDGTDDLGKIGLYQRL